MAADLQGTLVRGQRWFIALVKGLVDTVDANGVLVVVIKDVAVLAVLVLVIFVALVVAITLH